MDDKTATAAAAIMYQHLHQGSVLEGLQDNLRPQSRNRRLSDTGQAGRGDG